MVLSRVVVVWKSIAASALALGLIGGAEARTPSPAILVAAQGKNPGENALLIVDPATKAVVSRVPLRGQPHHIAVSPDGRFAYTSNSVRGTDAMNFPGVPKKAGDPDPLPQDTISIVDLDAQKEVGLVDVGAGANPHGIYFSAGKVYFTAEGNKVVGRYDPVRDVVDWTAGVGQNRVHDLVVTRDGSKIFTANIGSDNVALLAPWDPAFDALTFGSRPPPWNMTLIPVGNGAEGIGLTPDEKEVWIANRGAATVSVIDVATRKVVATIALNTKEPIRLTITPDGKHALVPGKTGEIIVLDTKTRKIIKRIPDVGTQIHGIVLSPDSLLAYAAVQASADVAIIDMKTLALAGRIPMGTGKEPFDGIDGLAWAQRH